MNRISVICIVKDRHPRLFEALESVKNMASEIIIADTGINEDLKRNLLELDKLKIISVPKPFTFAELIRENLKKYAKEQYILFIDHDEVIPSSLKKFILANFKKYDYFAIPRKNIIFNKWIKHNRWWPDYQIRLIKKDKVFWQKDIDIHKQPELKGKGLTIDPKEELAIIHYNYQNIDEYLHKAVYYAKQEASQLIRKNKEFTLSQMISKSISEFVSRFYANEGYKDGTHGFILSSLQVFYYFLVYYYYWEGKKYFDLETTSIVKNYRSFFLNGLVENNYWIVKKNFISWHSKIKYQIENKLLKIFR